MTQHHAPRAASTRGSDSSSGEIQLKLFARTDVGQIREHNEDNFLVADLTRRSRGLVEGDRARAVGCQGSLFAVCDGMGGAAAGEIASQLAVDILYERMVEGLEDARPLSRDDLARRLVRAIEAAGLRIFQEAKVDRSRRGMGTTVTAAALVDDHLFFAQVGDSRGYVFRQGQLVQLTRDQSLVNQLIEAGQLTEEEAETFEHNNIILQALGTADTVQVDLTYCELRRGDTVLLCSDGLSGMVRFDELRDILRATSEPVEACRVLTDRANQAGGHDNITVVVATFDGSGLCPVAPEGEPAKYCKYVLPEEPADLTQPGRRLSPDVGQKVLPLSDQPSAAGVRQGLASTVVFSPSDGQPLLPATVAAGPDHAPIPSPQEDEHIEIPGTHVPVWVVLLIVVAVIATLAGTAALLLM